MILEYANKPISKEYNIVFLVVRTVDANNEFRISVRGTGFIIKKNNAQYIVSCAHVYDQIPDLEKSFIACGVRSPETKGSAQIKKYNFYSLTFIKKYSDSNKDLCLLKFKDEIEDIKDYGYTPQDLCSENEIHKLNMLDPIIFLGYPLAGEFLYGYGHRISC